MKINAALPPVDDFSIVNSFPGRAGDSVGEMSCFSLPAGVLAGRLIDETVWHPKGPRSSHSLKFGIHYRGATSGIRLLDVTGTDDSETTSGRSCSIVFRHAA